MIEIGARSQLSYRIPAGRTVIDTDRFVARVNDKAAEVSVTPLVRR